VRLTPGANKKLEALARYTKRSTSLESMVKVMKQPPAQEDIDPVDHAAGRNANGHM
jgi:hypothetical protein